MSNPQQQQQAHQRNQGGAQQQDRWDGTTVYWYCAEDHEQKFAEEWIDEMLAREKPADGTVICTPDLYVDQITEKIRVVVLRRAADRDRSTVRRVDGMTTVDTKYQPVEASQPVYGRDHWMPHSSGNRLLGGRPNVQTMLLALSKQARPYVLHYRPASEPGVARLRYA